MNKKLSDLMSKLIFNQIEIIFSFLFTQNWKKNNILIEGKLRLRLNLINDNF